MSDSDFIDILATLNKYPAINKGMISLPDRDAEFKNALIAAFEMFPDARIYVKEFRQKKGSFVLCIETKSFEVKEEYVIYLFSQMIRRADGFEICTAENNRAMMMILFKDVFIQI